MILFDRERVRKIMLEDGYKEQQVDESVASMRKLNQKLQPLIDAYLKDKSLADQYQIEGLTIAMIMEKFDCDFWVGLEFLDDFVEDPERAGFVKEFSLLN